MHTEDNGPEKNRKRKEGPEKRKEGPEKKKRKRKACRNVDESEEIHTEDNGPETNRKRKACRHIR